MCVFHFHEFDSLMESYSEMKLLPSAIQLRSAAEGAKLSRNTKKINESISVFDALNTLTHTQTHRPTNTHEHAMLLLLL